MANPVKTYDIGFGTSIDTSGLEKGLSGALSKAESDVIRAAAKITTEVQNNAQEQVEIVRSGEIEKIAEIKRSVQEQIAAVKAMPDMSRAEKQKEIEAIKNVEKIKIQEVKTSTKLQETAISNMAKIQTKIIQDNAKKQLKAVQDGYKKSGQAIKDFAKGAIQQLVGMDQMLSAFAGGPLALGKLFVDMGKKAIAALNEMAAAYREQEQAEVALENAAKNNPYLNERNVKQLKNFAGEMQRMTGMDSMAIIQTETRLASLGRNQDQMQKIIRVAADMAAGGVMSYDEAINELNNSLNGMVRTSGRLYPELKNLSKEALASGKAIDIIAGKVSGAATEAMNTGAGSVTAYQNAVGDLKKIIGEGWEEATRPAREWLTKIIYRFNDAVEARKKIFELGSDTTVDLDAAFAKLTDAQKKELKRIGENAGALLHAGIEARLSSMNYGEAVEDALMTFAESIGFSVEMTRRAILEYGRLDDSLRETLILIGERTAAEHAAAVEAARIEAEREAAEAERTRVENKRIERESEAARFREENQKALNAEIEKIIRKAEIEGKSVGSLEVQKQILDANVQAYENLLSAAKEFIDGTAPEEVERLNRLKQEWQIYEDLVISDEQRKQRLSDLANRQKELANELQKIYEGIQGEEDRQAELAEERYHQEKLVEIKKESILEVLGFGNKSAKEAIEYEAQIEKDKLNRTFEDRKKQMDKSYAELSAQHEEGSAERLAIDEEYKNAVEQMELNRSVEIQNINREMNEAIEKADQESLQKRLDSFQTLINASQQIAGNISTIWTNAIDYQLNEDLRANDKRIQSDEERAQREKKLTMEAANDRYKADMFMWSSNVILASGQTAMAIMNALTTVQPWPAAIAAAIVAGAMGTMQVATVISAQPKKPRFHEGGVVQGRAGQEVPATLMAGEKVLTQAQFTNNMEAIANLAHMKAGGREGVNLNVKVENTMADTAEVSTNLNGEDLIVRIVDKALSDGRLDHGLSMQNYRQMGTNFQ